MLFVRNANYMRYCIAIMFFIFFVSLFILFKKSQPILLLDTRLSDFKRSQIHQYFVENSSESQDIFHILKEKFPVLNHMSVRYMGNMKKKICAGIQEPLLRIQDINTHVTHIMTDSELVYAADYQDVCIDHLPALFIDSKKDALKKEEIIDSFVQAPASLFDRYIIVYKNKNEIILYSKHQSLIIIADDHSMYESNKLAYAELLAEKKYLKGVIIDIRFAHGVVCSPKGR